MGAPSRQRFRQAGGGIGAPSGAFPAAQRRELQAFHVNPMHPVASGAGGFNLQAETVDVAVQHYVAGLALGPVGLRLDLRVVVAPVEVEAMGDGGSPGIVHPGGYAEVDGRARPARQELLAAHAKAHGPGCVDQLRVINILIRLDVDLPVAAPGVDGDGTAHAVRGRDSDGVCEWAVVSEGDTDALFLETLVVEIPNAGIVRGVRGAPVDEDEAPVGGVVQESAGGQVGNRDAPLPVHAVGERLRRGCQRGRPDAVTRHPCGEPGRTWRGEYGRPAPRYRAARIGQHLHRLPGGKDGVRVPWQPVDDVNGVVAEHAYASRQDNPCKYLIPPMRLKRYPIAGWPGVRVARWGETHHARLIRVHGEQGVLVRPEDGRGRRRGLIALRI